MKYSLLTIAFATLFLLSCKNDKKTKKPEPKPATTTQQEAPKETDTKKETDTIQLVINSNDQMRFDKKELRVKAGQEVTVTLNHTGKMKKAVMGHNWVLLKKGTDIPTFAMAAMAAKDNDYIANKEQIIAHTKTIGGGESTQVTFTAPDKGEYDFICSFPGHYALMKGKFIVE